MKKRNILFLVGLIFAGTSNDVLAIFPFDAIKKTRFVMAFLAEKQLAKCLERCVEEEDTETLATMLSMSDGFKKRVSKTIKSCRNKLLRSVIHSNNPEVLKLLIQLGIDPSLAAYKALDIRGVKGISLAQLALECGADPNYSCYKQTLLSKLVQLYSFQEGDIEVCLSFASELISLGADPTIRDREGNTLLHLLHMNPHLQNHTVSTQEESFILKMNRYLLSLGLDINVGLEWEDHDWTCYSSISPLYRAVSQEHPSEKIIEALLKSGADPNVQGPGDGNTLLHNLMKKQWIYKERKWQTDWNRAIITLLLEYGADPSVLNYERETVLGVALKEAPLDIVELLLKYGADPDKNEDHALYGSTKDPERIIFLLDLISQYTSRENFLKYLQALWGTELKKGGFYASAKLISYLIHKGMDPDVPVDGDYPLFHANCYRVTEALLENGADVNKKNDKGDTILLHHLTGYRPDYDMVKFLLDKGADPNISSQEKETPLHHAARKGDLRIVVILLDYGADPHRKNKAGETPLHVACKHNNNKIIQVLLRLEQK